jgi:hypothetical protein
MFQHFTLNLLLRTKPHAADKENKDYLDSTAKAKEAQKGAGLLQSQTKARRKEIRGEFNLGQQQNFLT